MSAPVVAMVGAGQLARMTQQAAIGLGVELRVLTDDPGESAAHAGAGVQAGSPDRLADLRALADGADVVTFDHERIPPEHLAALREDGHRLAPTPEAKRMAQDKLLARRTLSELGIPVPAFAAVQDVEDVRAFAAAHDGWPVVLKAARGGYDGRGVWICDDEAQAADVLDGLDGPGLVETFVPIERELAVLVARTPSGASVVYPVAETLQHDGMCREIVAPISTPLRGGIARRARELAVRIAAEIGATGILAVELFVTPDGLLVNELALRPHNSGHFTIEGCRTSQFEQHLRAVLDWPLGDPGLAAPAVATVNVIGPADGSDPRDRVAAALAVPGAHVHLYGKEARPGRKLGHVTVCGESVDAARRAARRAAALLHGEEAA